MNRLLFRLLCIVASICISFGLLAQFETPTTAKFLSKEKENAALTLAPVFPDTVEQLEGRTTSSLDRLRAIVNEANQLKVTSSIKELERTIQKGKTLLNSAKKEQKLIKAHYEEMTSYHHTKQEFPYVSKGIRTITSLYNKSNNLQTDSIQRKIEELERKKEQLVAKAQVKKEKQQTSERETPKQKKENLTEETGKASTIKEQEQAEEDAGVPKEGEGTKQQPEETKAQSQQTKEPSVSEQDDTNEKETLNNQPSKESENNE
ncbi:hypothetical protein ACFFGV_00275 [Pontibacillus salicampi]|uniref:DUF4047 domain-containing protein n=1 Tax=Pontibacillus salicampi TaxID=1449801 RepID=A0ABV6LI19_9BACI